MAEAAAEVAFLSEGWVRAMADAHGDLPRHDGVTVVVQHTVTGSPDGDATYWVAFDDGRTIDAGLEARPDATVTVTTPYALAAQVATGEVEASVAFMQGRSKVAGDQAALLGWLAVTATPAYRQATERLARRTRVTPLDA